MDLMYECKVPIQKAIWFFKMNQVAHSTLTFQNKPKRPNNFEQFSTGKYIMAAFFWLIFYCFRSGKIVH